MAPSPISLFARQEKVQRKHALLRKFGNPVRSPPQKSVYSKFSPTAIGSDKTKAQQAAKDRKKCPIPIRNSCCLFLFNVQIEGAAALLRGKRKPILISQVFDQTERKVIPLTDKNVSFPFLPSFLPSFLLPFCAAAAHLKKWIQSKSLRFPRDLDSLFLLDRN
jgi:hypothetical protein